MRRLAPILAITLLVAACTASDDTTQQTDVASTTTMTADPTTNGATTTEPPTTTQAPSTTTSVAPRRSGDALSGVGTAAGFGDPYDPELGNGGLDIQHYGLDLSFDPSTDTLGGLVTLEATALEDLAVFHLDFLGYEISEVLVDGRPAPFSRDGKELIIEPGVGLATGESFAVAVAYSGTPEPRLSPAIELVLGWLTDPDGDRYVLAEPDAAHTWFPCNDHPLDKATYEFRLTVPEPLLAAANGELIDTITDVGATTWVWEMDDPMATYLATVVIGDYEIVVDDVASAAAGIPIRNVLPADMASTPPASLVGQGEMIAFFADLFGPYPFDEYGIAIVDGVPGALETQTLSVFGSEVLSAGDVPIGGRTLPLFDLVLVHEIAHQWFGNNVSPASWQDIWLNEGFASYAEFLWIEHLVGRDVLETSIEQERRFWASTAEDNEPPGSPPFDSLFNGAVYRVGAMTLHALRLTVGDDAFFATLRTYHERFAGATANTADFIAVAEEVGDRDLSDLFQTWLYEKEVPAFPSP